MGVKTKLAIMVASVGNEREFGAIMNVFDFDTLPGAVADGSAAGLPWNCGYWD
jgi:hypothetical protein